MTLAGNDTTTQFIEGFGGTESPQLDRAVALLEEFAQQGRPVVAVTLSIGGNDLLEFGQSCSPGGGPPCPDRYERFYGLLERYRMQYLFPPE